MIFPSAIFPVAHRAQPETAPSSYFDGRIRLAGFADGAGLISHAAPVLELFVAKAAWLSDLLSHSGTHRFWGVMAPDAAAAANYPALQKMADLALCGLLWLSAANPVLAPLRACFVHIADIAHLDFLASSPAEGACSICCCTAGPRLMPQLKRCDHISRCTPEAERRLFPQVLYWRAHRYRQPG